MTDTARKPDDEINAIFARADALSADHGDHNLAMEQAELELLISRWPKDWGDKFCVVIYGDFQAPDSDIEIPELGIVIKSEELKNSVASHSAMCALNAIVDIKEKSISAIVEAGQRLNLLLGMWSLISWGNSGCGWWSYMTGPSPGGVVGALDKHDLRRPIVEFSKLPANVRQRLASALFWIRAPKNTMGSWHISDVLRVYAGYWNAFECLVDAITLLAPQPKLTPAQKQTAVDVFVSQCAGKFTVADIHNIHQAVVDPGFVGKASHALRVIFRNDGNAADLYIEECFKMKDRSNRLYDIRNAINHGEIHTEDRLELARIDSRMQRLWIIVWGMFGRLLPVPCPADTFENSPLRHKHGPRQT